MFLENLKIDFAPKMSIGCDPSSTSFGVSILVDGVIYKTLTIKPPSENTLYQRCDYVLEYLANEVMPLGEGELGLWYASAIEEPPPAQQNSALLYPYYYKLLDLFKASGVPCTFVFSASRLKSLILDGVKDPSGKVPTGKNPIRDQGLKYFGWSKKKNSHETEASYLADYAYRCQLHLKGEEDLSHAKLLDVLTSTKVTKKKRKYGKTIKVIETPKGMIYRPNELYYNWETYDVVR